jgi:hypothetical protein
VMRLLVETDIESGLRWGELTELRPKDLDPVTGVVTVARVVVHLRSTTRPDGIRFLVKHYPKDKEWRQVKLQTPGPGPGPGPGPRPEAHPLTRTGGLYL